jgi:hypothetical protein
MTPISIANKGYFIDDSSINQKVNEEKAIATVKSIIKL